MKKNGEDFFTLSEISEIFSRNKSTIQKYRQQKKISGFKNGNIFFYSFRDCLRIFKSYSEIKYRILSGGGNTAVREAEEKKQKDFPDFSRIENIRDKVDADFVLQLEKIRELRRENDVEEKKLISAEKVKSQAELLFSVLFDLQREFIEKIGIEKAFQESEIIKYQREFNSLLIDAKGKAEKIYKGESK